MKKSSSRSGVSVVGAAATAAVCAAFGTGAAFANQVIVPVDVLLGTYGFDADQDGTPEFTFSRNDTSIPPFVTDFTNSIDPHGNGVVGHVVPPTDPKPGPYASLLQSGELIDGSRNYLGGPSVLLSGAFFESFGDFYNQSGFAGLRFALPGEPGEHYGWAELHDTSGNLTVARIGYETQQDVGIVTPALVPEPGTLALLAAGAAGLLARRRRQREA